ncbi:hypothetical protein E4U43_007195 [Claviceps pusilla]|uniref:Xylanolytic transcriptional activator regulatory domain-containing protein n=1 Tax=Claviceps pusilla TaxID=123648 RepID=A0A9P7NEV3_9HYPO|nr:hypothetical protein E4U43_007195 [Claviceps pusilla]
MPALPAGLVLALLLPMPRPNFHETDSAAWKEKEDSMSCREAFLFKLREVEAAMFLSDNRKISKMWPICSSLYTRMCTYMVLHVVSLPLGSMAVLQLTYELGGEIGASRRETRSPLNQEVVPKRSLVMSKPSQLSRPEPSLDEAGVLSDKSLSVTPPTIESHSNNTLSFSSQPSSLDFEPEPSHIRPSLPEIALGIRLYFEFCHRQPIWCFDRADISDISAVTDELACSILAVTSRFSGRAEELQLYGDNARSLVMVRIANGTVGLPTIESLCLLSYSSFIDGNVHLGQFHLGMALQLCRSAMLDSDAGYAIDDLSTERKKRVFWSLQVLDQYHGRQTGILSSPTEIWRQFCSSPSGDNRNCPGDESKVPPLPLDDLGHTIPSEPGIWNTSVQVGWVWSRVRKYVSDCARGIFREPWRRDSTYATVLSDFMEAENSIPMCHRYDSVKFYERKVEDLKTNRDYWTTWLKEQFTYHAIPTVLNHPFLYIIGAQHNQNLAIPNTFWRRSSELALIHATWVVRMIEMAVDKQVHLTDPFFGHIAAIAATVHLYYCCAAASKLKHKSNADFAKCRKFLKGFIPFSPACRALDRDLEKMTRIAAGSDTNEVEDWMPSRIYLSVALMWNILQFNCTADSQQLASTGLLDASLASTVGREDKDETITIEIIVATSPEITVNTADGGQDAPTLSYKCTVDSSAGSREHAYNELSAEQADTLTFNTTPWLYADTFQFDNMTDLVYQDARSRVGSNRERMWWDGGEGDDGYL